MVLMLAGVVLSFTMRPDRALDARPSKTEAIAGSV
jgi:hypothetical protein